MKRISHILWFSVLYVLLLAGTSYPEPIAPPVISKAFGVSSIQLNGSTNLSFTITNPATNTVTLTGIGFTDTLPTGLTVADSSASVCGGTLTTTAPTGIALSGASIDISGQCVFNVTVTGAALGNYTNTTDNVTSINGGTGNAATANLTVANPFSLELTCSRFIPALTSTGNVQIIANASVINTSVTTTSADFTGSTIFTSGTVSLMGNANTKVSDGFGGLVISSNSSQMREDIIQYTPFIDTSNLFGSFFCRSKAEIKAHSDIIYNDISNGAVINGIVGRTIWCNNLVVNNGIVVLGSPSNPVVLVVDGNLTMNGNANFTIYGFVYVTGNVSISGNASLNIMGAVAVEGTALVSGNSIIWYNSDVLTKASNLTPLCNSSPSITSANSTSFTIGSAGSFTITTTGYPAPSNNYNGSLPVGVTFTDNDCGTATLEGTPAEGTAGIYPITFTASNGVLPDAMQNFTLTVTQAESTTSLNSSLNPSTFGQSVTFTATVSSGAGTPTGTVTFMDGATTLGTGTLNGTGQATFATSSLAVGDHTITAVYAGDASFSGSTSDPLTQTVNKADQTDLMLNADSPLTYNTTETLSTTGGSGTGAVTYKYESGSCSVSGNQLAANSGTGTCTVTATKAEDSTYNAATASATVALQKAATATIFNATIAFYPPPPAVTLTATVTSDAGTPEGTVTFKNSGAEITDCTNLTLSSGIATCTTTALPPGVNDITAEYSGNTNFMPSASGVVQISTLSGKMSRNSHYLSPEGWIVRAYTRAEAPNEVYIEVIDIGNNIVDPSHISGMTGNPLLVASDAVAPEVSLGFDKVNRTAHVTYTSAGGRQVVSVPGIREAPQMEVTPEPVLFGTVKVGSNIKKTVTVTNTGNVPLHLTAIVKPGAPFRITGTSTCAVGTPVEAGGSCSIVVKFAPTAVETYNNSFVISSDGGEATVHLNGTGGK